MPKKASTTPVKPQRKTTPTVKAETDTKWEKLSGVTSPRSTKTRSATPTAKQKTISQSKKAGTTAKLNQTASKTSSLEYSNDPDKFPYSSFPIRLEYKDGNDKKTCWFQCYDHYIKHITRYKVTEYDATTNDMALVGEVTGAKSKRVR